MQCDYEDFEPMDERVAQYYDDLYDIYVQLEKGLSYSPKLPILKTLCMILLTRFLCRRLTRQAKISLKVFFQASNWSKPYRSVDFWEQWNDCVFKNLFSRDMFLVFIGKHHGDNRLPLLIRIGHRE